MTARPLINPLKLLAIFLVLAGLPALAGAAGITVGEKFPSIAISDLGECVLKGDETAFAPWSSDGLDGKVQVVEYVAARAGIDDIHRPFFDALAAADYPAGAVGIVKLVNSDDALWGTSGLVAGEIRKNKKEKPEHRLVVDAEGLGQQQWDLEKKNAALAILDSSGTVLFFKEGSLTDQEIAQTIATIGEQLRQPAGE